ncbi:Dual function macrocyclase-peptidase POPB, partial [Dissostichus eleginoides]
GPACVVTLDTPCVAASMTLGDKHLKPARSRLDGVLDGGTSLAPGPPQDFTPPHSPLSLQRFHSFSGGRRFQFRPDLGVFSNRFALHPVPPFRGRALLSCGVRARWQNVG